MDLPLRQEALSQRMTDKKRRPYSMASYLLGLIRPNRHFLLVEPQNKTSPNAALRRSMPDHERIHEQVKFSENQSYLRQDSAE
jgi:hypothetical protein